LGEEHKFELSDKKVDALFIRKENIRRLLDKGNQGCKKDEIPLGTKFENNALINYIEKIYFPIRDYQES